MFYLALKDRLENEAKQLNWGMGLLCTLILKKEKDMIIRIYI
jgi:hypothetical protein